MTNDFLNEHFLELLADAFIDNRSLSQKACTSCGKPSTRTKCEPCYRKYRVKVNVAGRRNRKARANA